MRQVLLLSVAVGCTVGPKLVSVPMLESSPVVPRMTAEEDEGSTPHDEVANVTGAWTGTACCHRGAQSWPLQVTFDAVHDRDVVAHAYYPDQRCRADWRLHATDSRHWQGAESVTVDPFRRCPDHGRVSLDVMDEETLSWRWERQGESLNATLSRTGTPQPD